MRLTGGALAAIRLDSVAPNGRLLQNSRSRQQWANLWKERHPQCDACYRPAGFSASLSALSAVVRSASALFASALASI